MTLIRLHGRVGLFESSFCAHVRHTFSDVAVRMKFTRVYVPYKYIVRYIFKILYSYRQLSKHFAAFFSVKTHCVNTPSD